jgi:hypothetical protein
MKLRDHPALVLSGGFRSWPPIWVHSRGTPEVKKLHGEIGVFTGTIRHEAVPSTIFLRMEFENESYLGFLVVGKPMFCLQLDNLLQEHVGRTIAEIGDIDLSFTL